MTSFNPVFNGREIGQCKSSFMEPLAIKAHDLPFLLPQRSTAELDDIIAELKRNDGAVIDEYMDDLVKIDISRFEPGGVSLRVCEIAALSGFGILTAKSIPRSIPRLALESSSELLLERSPLIVMGDYVDGDDSQTCLKQDLLIVNDQNYYTRSNSPSGTEGKGSFLPRYPASRERLRCKVWNVRTFLLSAMSQFCLPERLLYQFYWLRLSRCPHRHSHYP